jgi:hypothetical protein
MTVRGHSGIPFEKFNGLWDRGDKDSTPIDHFTECDNIKFIASSSFGTRPGIGLSQNVAVPLSNIKRIYNYPTQEANTLIVLTYDVATDTGKIYHVVDSTTVFGPLLTIVGMTDFAFIPYAGRGYISPFRSQDNTLHAPLTALTTTPINGTDINTGLHKYATTFVTAAGETVPSPLTEQATSTVAIADPVIAPVITDLGAGTNALVAGGSYLWKFVYAVDNGATLLTLPGPASAAFVPASTAKRIGLQTPSNFPAGAVLVGIYRTTNGGGTYYAESTVSPNGYVFPGAIPLSSTTTYFDVGLVSDAVLVTHAVAPGVNNTTKGRVNLSNIPTGPTIVTARKVYRTEANLSVLKLLTTLADNVTTVFADISADAALGATAPTVNSALIPGIPILKGLQNEFLYVYAGDGTAARKAAGAGISGTMTVANGADGHTDPGLHLFGIVSETRSGYLSPPGALSQFTTIATKSVSFGNIPTSGDPNVVKRHLVATLVIPAFNGDMQGYTYYFVPDGTIDNNTDTFLNNVSFYDADLLEDASHLFDNYTEIPAGAHLSTYHDRLVLGATYNDISLLLVSEPGEPEAINQITGLIVVPLDGNPITNAQELRDVLYVFKRSRTVSYADNGEDPSSWPLVVVDNALGTSVHGIATVLDSGSSSIDYLIICTYQGMSLFNGRYQTPELSWKIENLWRGQDRLQFGRIQIINAPIQKEIYCILPDRRLLVGNYGNGMDHKSIRWAPWSFYPGLNTVAVVGVDEIILGTDLVT